MYFCRTTYSTAPLAKCMFSDVILTFKMNKKLANVTKVFFKTILVMWVLIMLLIFDLKKNVF